MSGPKTSTTSGCALDYGSISALIHSLAGLTNKNPRLIAGYYLDCCRKLGSMSLEQMFNDDHFITLSSSSCTFDYSERPRFRELCCFQCTINVDGTFQHRWMRKHQNIKPEIMWFVILHWCFSAKDTNAGAKLPSANRCPERYHSILLCGSKYVGVAVPHTMSQPGALDSR